MDLSDHLIDDHLDGELTSESSALLRQWLEAQDEHVREFAIHSLIHSLLHDCMSQRQVQADALLRALTTRAELPAAVSMPDSAALRTGVRHQRIGQATKTVRAAALGRFSWFRDRIVVAIAAALFVLAVAAVVLLPARPKVVAMLTQSAGARWESVEGPVADGAILYQGDELRLVEGRAMIHFVSGARIVIDAPTVATIRSPMMLDIDSGAVTTFVPVQAVGFTINTPRARFVDLGTEFTVRTERSGAFMLQVFHGMVELLLRSANGQFDNSPLRITEGTAVRVPPESSVVESIPYDPSQRMIVP